MSKSLRVGIYFFNRRKSRTSERERHVKLGSLHAKRKLKAAKVNPNNQVIPWGAAFLGVAQC